MAHFVTRKNEGFSLLELSIVLTIVAIVIAGGLTLGSAKTQLNKVTNDYEEMKEIAESISVFVNEHGCLPYPADNTALPGAATYGREPAANAECATTGGTGAAVLEGDVPFYSLGLPDEYGSDSYASRYIYAVTDTATESTFSSSFAGAITVNDDGGTAIGTDITYVLVSTGKTYKGGRSVKTGTVGTACDATEKDGENCNSDATFVDGVFNDGTTPANLYDDILIWKTTSGIYEYGAGAGAGGGGGGSIPTCKADMSNIQVGDTCDDGSKFLGSHPYFAWQGFYAADVDQSSSSTWDNAITLCDGLDRHGNTDWYLPSKSELNHLYENKTAIGGFTTSNYWSSTEGSATDAWNQHFGNGTQGDSSKANNGDVRCVRRG